MRSIRTFPNSTYYGIPRWKWCLRQIPYGFLCILDGLVTILSLGFLSSGMALNYTFWITMRAARAADRAADLPEDDEAWWWDQQEGEDEWKDWYDDLYPFEPELRPDEELHSEPLVHEADPVLEALLNEEECIEYQATHGHKGLPSCPGGPNCTQKEN